MTRRLYGADVTLTVAESDRDAFDAWLAVDAGARDLYLP